MEAFEQTKIIAVLRLLLSTFFEKLFAEPRLTWRKNHSCVDGALRISGLFFVGTRRAVRSRSGNTISGESNVRGKTYM